MKEEKRRENDQAQKKGTVRKINYGGEGAERDSWKTMGW